MGVIFVGSLAYVGDFDIDVGILCPVEQIGEQWFGVGFVGRNTGNVINGDVDFGEAGDNGFDRRVVFGFAKQVETQAVIAGTGPERVFVACR